MLLPVSYTKKYRMYYATAREFLAAVQQRYRALAAESRSDHPTGIARGVADTIDTLLFRVAGGFQLATLQRLRFRRLRVVDGVLCRAVSGLHPHGGRITAWFGADDLLLRRLQRHGWHVVTSTTPGAQAPD
ncbi:hypothetical protein ACLB1G_06610 [Oxalobacteraceae bacterium A2-2]